MKQNLLILICIFLLQIANGQAPANKKLIQYEKSPEPTVSAYATIFIPSLLKETGDTALIRIKRRDDVWIYINYRYKNTGDQQAHDTCYISTITESTKQYNERNAISPLTGEQEFPCYNADGNCNYIISSTEIHYVRFRIRERYKVYKLIVTI